MNYRVYRMRQQVARSSRPEAFNIDWMNNRPQQLRELSRKSDPVRRMGVLWMLGKLMGKPPKCRRCRHHVTVNHLEHSCLGRMHIDRLMHDMEFDKAAGKIIRVMEKLVIDERFVHWMMISVVGFT